MECAAGVRVFVSELRDGCVAHGVRGLPSALSGCFISSAWTHGVFRDIGCSGLAWTRGLYFVVNLGAVHTCRFRVLGLASLFYSLHSRLLLPLDDMSFSFGWLLVLLAE